MKYGAVRKFSHSSLSTLVCKNPTVMFGGLHFEMALGCTLADLLDASRWTTALVEAEVASPLLNHS